MIETDRKLQTHWTGDTNSKIGWHPKHEDKEGTMPNNNLI